MSNIITYAPVRDSKGRFASKSIRKFLLRCLKYQLITLLVIMNAYLAGQIWNVRCSEGGWFVRRDTCHSLYTNKLNSQEVAREAMLKQMQDEAHMSDRNKQALRAWQEPLGE